MKRCATAALLIVCAIGGAHAELTMDVGGLAKFARDTGMPAKAILSGSAAEYLRTELKTELPIYAEAVVIRKIDDKCNRFRINLTIPGYIVKARNPANPDEVRTGPFEAAMELNLCS